MKKHVVLIEMLVVVDLREVVGLREQQTERRRKTSHRHLQSCQSLGKKTAKSGGEDGTKFTPEWGMFPCTHMIPESCVSRNLVGFDGFFWF